MGWPAGGALLPLLLLAYGLGEHPVQGSSNKNAVCDFEQLEKCAAWPMNCRNGACWKVVKAKNVSEGPATDHTTGKDDGLYARATFPAMRRRKQLRAVLETSARGPLCFMAWLHISALRLPVVQFTSTAERWPIWKRFLDTRIFLRGRMSEMGLWQKVVYYDNRRDALKIQLQSAFTDGTVAVDDLSITPGNCPAPSQEGSCTFENSGCGYTNDPANQKGHVWLRRLPWQSISKDVPLKDHTTQTKDGGYAFYTISMWEKSSGVLTSAVLSKPESPKQCLRFFYFVPYASQYRGLLVQIIRNLQPGSRASSQLNVTTEQRDETLWSRNVALLPKRWAPAEVRYTATDKYKLHFRCYSTVESGNKFYCAIDDVEVYPCGDKKGEKLSCGFDDGHLCKWQTSSEAGDTPWLLSDIENSLPELPRQDHTLGTSQGKFIYVENKAKNSTLKATLLSPPLDPDWVGAACLSFWHFAVLEHPSSCNLTVSSANESEWWSSSQQLKRSWSQEVIRIWLQKGKGQVSIQASLETALIALDDIILSYGPCPSEKWGLSCDFERGPCTWTNAVSKWGKSEWFVRGGQLRSTLPRPAYDHTLGTPQGSYAFLSGARPYAPLSAMLASEYVNLMAPGVQCMDFWFIVRAVAGTKLRVLIELTNYQKIGQEVVWAASPSNSSEWRRGQLKIPRMGRVIFEGEVVNSKESYAAIDDISIDVNSNCRTIPQDAVTGKQAYALLDCSWNAPQLCQWGKVSTIDALKNSRSAPPKYLLAPTFGTGDHRGSFMYTACDNPSSPIKTSLLQSTLLSPGEKPVCLHFNVHMFSAIGWQMNLSQITQTKKNVLFSSDGQTTADRWYTVKRTVSLNVQSHSQLQFSFSNKLCQSGGVALGDIHATPGNCGSTDDGRGLCDFETGMCNWNAKGAWKRVPLSSDKRMSEARRQSGPLFSGFCLLLSSSQNQPIRASLDSPLWSTVNRPRLLELWYIVDGPRSVNLSVELQSSLSTTMAAIWRLPTTAPVRTWNLARVEISPQELDFKVVIQGSLRRASGYRSLLALADIRLSTHPSSHVANCNFEEDLCGYSSVSGSDPGFRWFVGTGRVRKPLLKTFVPALPLVGLSEGLEASKTFAYVDTTVPLQGSQTNASATLRSPVFRAGQNDTLLLRYFRNGNSTESFMVYQSVWNNGDQTSKWVQLGSFHDGDDWQDFEVPLVAAAESQIHVVITRSNQQTGFAAIASISVGHPRAVVPEAPYKKVGCDFENATYCNWKPERTSGSNLEWKLNDPKNRVPVFPNFDHTTGSYKGHYVYVERNKSSDVASAQLKGPTVSTDLLKSMCFSFWYFLLVDGNSSFSVLLSSASDVAWRSSTPRLVAWTHGQAQFQEFALEAGTQIVLEARIQTGLVALDDLSAMPGPCPATSMCSFEGGIDCGLEPDLNNARDWAIVNGSSFELRDHSTDSTAGHLLYLNTTYVDQKLHSFGRVFMPERGATAATCLTFWWRAFGADSTLNVYNFRPGTGLGDPALTFVTSENPWWNARTITFWSEKTWQVAFEALVPEMTLQESGVLLDDIELVDGVCPHENFCTFESPTCLHWRNSDENNVTRRWSLQRAGLSPVTRDHTLNSDEGHYLLFKEDDPGQQAALVLTDQRYRCATLWHYISEEPNNLTVIAGGVPLATSTSGEWKLAIFSVDPINTVISAISGGRPDAFAAIDDLKLLQYPCYTTPTPVKPPFVCAESGKKIPAQARCNFIADCSDGSDEQDCGSCSFENATCGWSVDGPDVLHHDDFSWKRQKAAAALGPMRDHSTNLKSGHYLLLRASKRIEGKTMLAEASSPTLHNTGHLCVVKFWFNYRAPNNTHKLLMELHVNGFQIVVWDSWELAENPQQGKWNEGQFLLGRYRSAVQILLRGYDSPADDSYTAIDDISFQGCDMPVPTSQQSPGMFACKNRVAVVMEHRCDYIDHCGDLSDEEDCDDYKFRCNFDSSFCDWTPLEASRGGGWTRVKPFPSLTRGPTRDHTSGGKGGSFLYLKSKAKTVVASLLGPQLNASTLCVMRFYYTIQGPTNAVLTVKTRSTADGDFNDVWKSDRPTEFRHFTEAFVPFREASDFEVFIEGSIEGARNVQGYIAIDDITFLDSCHAASGALPKRSAETTTSAPSNCSHGEFTCLSAAYCIPASQLCDFLKQCPDGSDESHCGACDFSEDLCGLQPARTQSQPRWTRLSALMVSNNRMRFPSLPREDSGHNERGFYAAFLKTDAAVPSGRNTALMTPQLGAMGHACRLTFYTFLPKQHLPVYVSVDVVETLTDTDKIRTLRKKVLRAWEYEAQVTWKMQAVNVGNRRPGTRFYFSAGENASIDDIEYHHCHPDEKKEESVNCTFEEKIGCGWYPENIADSGDWEIISGIPSFAVPDHTTGNGMYLALENFQESSVVAHMVSAKVNATGTSGRCFRLWYHMQGESKSRLTLRIFNVSGPDSSLWTKSGHQGNIWIEAAVNIKVIDGPFQLLLEGELPGYSPGFIGVDDISFDERSCPPTLTCDFEEGPCDWTLNGWALDTGKNFKVVPNDHTTGTNTGTFARLDGQSGRLVSAAHDLSLAERRCFRFWHFFTGQRETTLSVYKHAAAPEESRRLVWTINGEDRLPNQWSSGSVNIAVNNTSSMRLELEGKNPSGNESGLAVDDLFLSGWECPRPGSCSFEDDLCNWRNVGGIKNLSWERWSGPTPDRSGPAADHTVGSRHGYFLLLDAESARKNRVGILESELLHYSPKSCLQFYYYVDPAGTQADLSVEYARRGKPFRHVQVLAKERSAGWKLFRSVQNGLPEAYNIRISGYPGNDEAFDIAIDDIEVFDHDCTENIPQRDDSKEFRNSTTWDCDFDMDLCSWNQSESMWFIRSGRTAILKGNGPHVDSKLRSPEGKYAYYSPQSSSPSSLLTSAPLQPSRQDYCIEFWYFFYSLAPARLLMGLTNADSSSIDRVSWLQQRGFDRTWRRGSFVVPSKDVAGKRLAMHVQQQEEDLALAEVALDQMRVAPSGRCRHPAGSLCDFEGDGFCGFQVDSTGGGKWRMAGGSKDALTSQYSDHTFGDLHGGHFLLLHLNEQKPKQDSPYVATLVLPDQPPTKGGCLTLWYFVDGTGVGHLNVSVRVPGSTMPTLQDVLFGIPSTGWRYASATVKSASMHEVLLTAEVEQGGLVAVGLDDISLSEGQCPENGRCDFEGPDMCGWENADSGVQRMWVRNRGYTPKSSSGPRADHTLGTRDGTYVYLDGRTRRDEKIYTGILKSQRWTGSSAYCFSVWLHMGGTDVEPSTGSVRVIVAYVNEYGREKRESVIVVTGNQEKRWHQKKVTIGPVSSSTAEFVEFSVLIAGTTGGSQGGNIAIDDINMSHGPCHESLETKFLCHDGITLVNISQVCDFNEDCPVSGDDEQLCGQCDFDVDTCGWFSEHDSSSWNWTIAKDVEVNSPLPRTDRNMGDAHGGYVYTAWRDHVIEAEKLLHSPNNTYRLKRSGKDCTLSFWYFISGYSAELIVHKYILDHDVILWLVEKGGGNVWTKGQATIGRSQSEFSLAFEADSRMSTSKTFIAVDTVSFEDCALPTSSPGNCTESHDFMCPESNVCIRRSQLCDHVDDCGDGSDEAADICQNYTSCTYEPGADPCAWQSVRPEHKAQSLVWSIYTVPYLKFDRNTGPHTDHTMGGLGAGRVLLLRPSERGHFNSTAFYRSPNYVTDNEGCSVTFHYFIHGQDVGGIALFAQYQNYTEKSQWESLYEIKGPRDQSWIRASAVLYSNKPFCFVIEGSLGVGYASDIAIDDISVSPGCMSYNGTLPNPAPPPMPKCRHFQFACRDGGCIPDQQVCDFEVDCADGSDEEMCGPCNFENGTCGWIDVSRGANGWQIMQAKDLAEPETDHSTQSGVGHLVALKAQRSSSKAAMLLSPMLPPSSSRCSVSFWYYYNDNLAAVKLNVLYVLSENTSAVLAEVTPSIGWTKTVLGVPRRETRDANIAFNASIMKLNRMPNIGIDDISFLNCRPNSVLIDCSFDQVINSNSFCHWQNTRNESEAWKVVFPRNNYDGVGPTADHTSGRGGYAIFYSNGTVTTSIASLESAEVRPSENNVSCLTFWYSMNSGNELSLVIEAKSARNSAVKFAKQSADTSGWNFGELLVSLQEHYTFTISAVLSSKAIKGAFIAIDDVTLSEGPCRREGFCDFETDFCNWKLEKQGLSDGWKQISAATDTVVGPTHDHTLGTAYGHYALVVPRRQGDRASLYSPVLEKSRYRCLRYWFNMAGNGAGTLSVYQRLNGSSSTDDLKPAWSRSGDQMGAWRRGHVTLRNLLRYQVVIEAFTTTANTSGYSHIALDDVEFSFEPCEDTVTCTFESDACGWLSDTNSSRMAWIRTTGYNGVAIGGPDVDVTTSSSYGSYMLAKVGNTNGRTEIILLSDYVDVQRQNSYCFSLWYIFYDTTNSSLLVKSAKDGDTNSELLLNLTDGQTWAKEEVVVLTGEEYQRSFQIIAQSDRKANQSALSGIAIDEVEFFYGSCKDGRSPSTVEKSSLRYPPHPLDCDFEQNDCAWTNGTTSGTSVWLRKLSIGRGNLGPSLPETDHTTKSVYGSFAYLDFASTVTFEQLSNDNAILESEFPLHVDRDGACLKFWFFALGETVAPLTLRERDAVTRASRVAWTNVGSKGPQWNYARVHFEGDSAVFLSFEASKVQGGYTALDDIAVNVGPCPTPPLCDFEADDCGWRARDGSAQLHWERLTARDAIGSKDHTFGSESGHVLAVNTSKQGAEKGATVTVFSETQEARSSGCARFWYQLSSGHKLSLGTSQGGTLRPEAIFRKSQLHGSGVWNSAQVSLKYSPTMPFEYYLQVTLDSKGGVAAVDDFQLLSHCSNLGSCDFETDFCLWENEPVSSGSALWGRFTGRSHMVGPEVDHTFSESFGTYVAIKNNLNSSDLPSALVSPHLSKCDICFSFWSYHVGSVPHMLNLFLRTESGDDAIEYSATADVSGRWVKAQTNISTSAAECRIGFSLTFPAFRSALLALDDFIVVTGRCKPLEDTNHPEFSCDNETKHLTRDRICNFENECADGEDEQYCGTACSFESKDTCYWKVSGTGAQWSLEQARNNSLAEPTQDHTTGTKDGSFLRFRIKSAYDNERSAVIVSPNLIDASPTCTLGFWYYSTLTSQRAIIKVAYGFLSKLRLQDTTILLMSGHNGTLERKKWRYATARIGRVSERFSVKFVGNFKSFDKTFLIDDVKFSHCNRNEAVWVAGAGKCPSRFFSCANGNCIPKETVCDFNDDCGDLSDERLSPRVKCTSFPARCDFEDSVCDWKLEGTAWGRRLNKRDESMLINDDLRDHTTNSLYGNFLRLSFADQSLKSGIFSSPIIAVTKDAECSLRFFYTYQTRFTHLDYRLYSLSAGSLAVYVRFDLLGEKRIVWKTSNVFGQYYERKIIALKKFEGPMQILIEATTGTDLNGAWAIDDISFTDGCAVLSLDSLPVLASEATTKAPYSLCSSEEFACPERTCISLSRVCDFVDDCKGGADEENCATCNFDSSTCGWQDVSSGRYLWERLQAGRNSTNPSSDVSGKGFFLGVTAGDGVVSSSAVLKSVPHGASSGSCYLEMFYYANNVVPGTDILKLSILGENSSSETVLLALRSPESEKWSKVSVEIGRRVRRGWSLKLEATPSTPRTAIALDEISLVKCGRSPLGSDCESKGELSCKEPRGICYSRSQLCDWNLDCPDGSDELDCSSFPERCNFENGMCGWTEELNQGHARWRVTSGDTLSNYDEPTFDHTLGNSSGHFLFLRKENLEKSHASLKSLHFKRTTTRNCRLRFWYVISENAALDINILDLQSNELHKIHQLRGNDTVYGWRKVDASLSCPNDFQVVLNGSPEGSIAIDDVSFTPDCFISQSSVVPTVSPGNKCNDETEFRCKDNSCVLKELVCDFKPDCPFGSDEAQCPSSCSFEHGDCGWSSPNLPERVSWRSLTAMEATERIKNSPALDVTKNSSSGSYLFFYMAHDGDKIDEPIRMLTKTFQQSTPDCKISFYHWLTIPVIHVRLLVIADGSEDTLLWERTSNKLAKSWTFESIGVGRRSGRFRLAFEVDSPSRGGGLHFAVDEVHFVDCGYPKNNKFSGEPCSKKDAFRCKSRKFCIASEKTCDLYDDCGDGSDEVGCKNQRVTFEDENTGVLAFENPNREDSEGSLQFVRGRSPFRKNHDTGPLFDHTTFNRSGVYVEFGGAFHGFNKIATLSSLTLLPGSCRVSFHSYMFGRQVNLLTLYLRYFKNSSNSAKEVWRQEGSKGDFWERHHVDVTEGRDRQLVFLVHSGKGPEDVIALDDISFGEGCRFTTRSLADESSASSSSTTANPKSGHCDQQKFACLSDGVCLPSDRVCDFRKDCTDGSDETNCVQPSCDFENAYLCGWAVTNNASLLVPAPATGRFTTYSLENEFTWKLIQANDQSDRANLAMRPEMDHSEGTEQGWYVLANSAYGRTTDASQLYSPHPLSRTAGTCRLQAWYYCSDGCPLQLLLYTSGHGVHERPLWTAFRMRPKEWMQVKVPLGIVRGAHLAWRAWRGKNQRLVQALDELNFLSCDPPTDRGSTCPEDKFRCIKDNWCIERSQLCDQTWDCEDGSDETTVACSSMRSRCSFEDVHCEDWANDAARYAELRWSRRIAPVAESNLPMTDHSTSSSQGAYVAVYNPWDEPVEGTNRARLASYVISAAPRLPCHVRFWYNVPRRGVALDVYRQTSSETGGDDHMLTLPVTGEDNWERADIDLGSHEEVFRVVIEAVFSSNATRQGAALDDITMTDGCRRADRVLPGKAPANQTNPSTECGPERLSCDNGGCYLPSQRCNFIVDCKDASDESGCGASCNFEKDLCGWFSSLSEEEKWYRTLGDTSDHTLGTTEGHYLRPGIGLQKHSSGARAQLHSNIFKESGPECIFSFWFYSAEKINMSFLNVYVKQAKVAPKVEKVLSLAENAMTQKRWMPIKINVGRRVAFGVIVEAVWGTSGHSSLHLDDFLYQKCRSDHHASSCAESEWMCADLAQCVSHFERCDGKRDCSDGSDERDCVHGFGDCSFDEEDWAAACNWTVDDIGGQPSWKRAKESHSEDTGPPSSHRGTPGTYFLLANSTELPLGSVAVARTPQFPASQNKCHLRFWYFMRGSPSMEFLRVETEGGGSRLPMWQELGPQGSLWAYAHVMIGHPQPFTVAFLAQRGGDALTDIAIDEVTFTPSCLLGGTAHTEKHPSLCTRDEFLCADKRMCLPRSFVCDCENDCEDGSDETDCGMTCKAGATTASGKATGRPLSPASWSVSSTPSSLCTAPGAFSCGSRNGPCIPGLLLCDGVPDCPNAEDEWQCDGKGTCPEGYYYCRDPSSCLHKSKLCDGRADCSDESDESLCNACPDYFCRNGGSCKLARGTGAPQCACLDVFGGNRCDRELTVGPPSPVAQTHVAGWSYGAPLVIIFVVASVIVAVYFWRRRVSTGEETAPVTINNPTYGLYLDEGDTSTSAVNSLCSDC
ncbi:MAM and LDL-receptor class A domain-containing protein 1-like [Dermacentor variabilis]|uniref:MAM and LDL-receptor class A domain-containing protein 1-like n=1 Tax=Dermacentor variabilis TaxID=34621 RepID=UPI003F5B855D